MPLTISDADPALHAAACAAIYAPHVDPGPASFEAAPPDAAEVARRIERAHAWLVALAGDEVAGFAYAGQHRDREAYRWACDVSVYLAPAHHRRGAGRALHTELLRRARALGLRHACAGITLPNPASVALHEALGFRLVGVYEQIGFKAGAWRDVGWWQLDFTLGPR